MPELRRRDARARELRRKALERGPKRRPPIAPRSPPPIAVAAVRLADLHPKWTGEYGTERWGMGLVFDCPVHREGCRIAVDLANPLDGGPPTARTRYSSKAKGQVAVFLWQRSGTTFEGLTLHPSVNQLEHEGGPSHWHGWVKNGEVTTC